MWGCRGRLPLFGLGRWGVGCGAIGQDGETLGHGGASRCDHLELQACVLSCGSWCPSPSSSPKAYALTRVRGQDPAVARLLHRSQNSRPGRFFISSSFQLLHNTIKTHTRDASGNLPRLRDLDLS